MNTTALQCIHCAINNTVAKCRECGRHFVVTDAQIRGDLRGFESKPVDGFLENEFDTCDFCFAKSGGMNPAVVVQAGLRQRTCPNCHTDFLSDLK
jgi:hypothetical protein